MEGLRYIYKKIRILHYWAVAHTFDTHLEMSGNLSCFMSKFGKVLPKENEKGNIVKLFYTTSESFQNYYFTSWDKLLLLYQASALRRQRKQQYF